MLIQQLDHLPLSCRAAVSVFKELYGVTVTEQDFVPYMGMGENLFLGGVAEKYGFSTPGYG